jgi:hypothetical protein
MGGKRVTAIYTYRLFITSGGFAYYGINTLEQFRKVAEYSARPEAN